MRTIKFRAWDGQKMITPVCIDAYGQWYETDRAYEDARGDLKGLMQFTGLHDKNGVDVFEGDVIMFLDRDWIDYEKDTRRWPVVFENCEFILKSVGLNKYGEHNYASLFRDYGRDRFEVIGNIYQNPELLTPPNHEKQ